MLNFSRCDRTFIGHVRKLFPILVTEGTSKEGLTSWFPEDPSHKDVDKPLSKVVAPAGPTTCMEMVWLNPDRLISKKAKIKWRIVKLVNANLVNCL